MVGEPGRRFIGSSITLGGMPYCAVTPKMLAYQGWAGSATLAAAQAWSMIAGPLTNGSSTAWPGLLRSSMVEDGVPPAPFRMAMVLDRPFWMSVRRKRNWGVGK